MALIARPSRTSAVPGTVLLALVAWLLAFSRWGSYVGIPFFPQVYVTEIGLTALAVAVIATRSSSTLWMSVRGWPRWLAIPLGALIVWAVVRLIAGGVPGIVALRDFAPFGYLAAAAAATLQVPRRWAQALVIAACALHTAWFTLSYYWPSTVVGLPRLGTTALLQIRTDVDAMLCGVAAAIFIVCALHVRSKRWSALLLLLALHNLRMLVSIDNRAGLLAGGLAVGCAVVIAFRQGLHVWQPNRRRMTVAVAMVGVVLVGLATFVVTGTAAGERMLSTFSRQPGVGTGTRDARLLTYGLVLDYITRTPERALFGVGFGPDFLHASRGDQPLEGTEFTGVRSPHMFILGTWARLGLIGAALQFVVVTAGAWLALRVLLRRTQPDLTLVLASCLALAIPVAAAIGVVLESPFGAMPYAWSIGVMATAAARAAPEKTLARIKRHSIA